MKRSLMDVKGKYVSNSFINVSMYLVFTTNWEHNKKIKIIYK